MKKITKRTNSRISLVALVALMLVALASATTTWSSRTSQTPRAVSDEDEIESVARDYIEGWYTGDVERMDRSLHADLIKRIPVDEDSLGGSRLHTVSRARMLELTTQGGGEDPDAVIEILVDDVATDIATARVISPEYLDYLHLAKTPDGWKIVNVLFNMRN